MNSRISIAVSPSKRRKIHTETKFLINQGALPEYLLKQLHRSQIHRYQNLERQDYFGNELFSFSNGVMNLTRQVAHNNFDRKNVIAYLRIMSAFRNTFSSAKHFHKTLENSKEQLVDVIQRVQCIIPIKSCAKIIGVCESTIHNWITQVRVKCSGSLINLCRKVHPSQLLPSETHAMKELLLSDEFKYWPLRSLYFHALNNKIVSMGESTWYKYVHLLGISRLKPRSIKIYKKGLRASSPNEYWHADVTYFKTADGVVNYIYTVIDNFSKFPLAVLVNTKLSGEIRVQSFRDAIRFALTHSPEPYKAKLIVDGGSENFNCTVDEFLNNPDAFELTRIRALKDIAFSNSMAEAFNRILKTYYLNNIPIENTEKLISVIDFVKQDFSYKRPHGLLKGLTPFKVFTGTNPKEISFTPQLLIARKERIQGNRNLICHSCFFQ